MSFRPVWALAVLAALAAAATTSCAPRSSGTAKMQWGEPAGGFQVGLCVRESVAGPRPRFALVFAVRNAGDKQVRFLKLAARSGFWGQKLPVEVAVAGKPCAYKGPTPGKAEAPPADAYVRLAPGAEDSAEAVLNPEQWGLQPPFAADVTFVFGQSRSGPVRIQAGR